MVINFNDISSFTESGDDFNGFCFSGGGLASFCTFSGIFNSLITLNKSNVQSILANKNIISGNSGGSWFISALLYSESFKKLLDDSSNFKQNLYTLIFQPNKKFMQQNDSTNDMNYLSGIPVIGNVIQKIENYFFNSGISGYLSLFISGANKSVNWSDNVKNIYLGNTIYNEIKDKYLGRDIPSWSNIKYVTYAASINTSSIIGNNDKTLNYLTNRNVYSYNINFINSDSNNNCESKINMSNVYFIPYMLSGSKNQVLGSTVLDKPASITYTDSFNNNVSSNDISFNDNSDKKVFESTCMSSSAGGFISSISTITLPSILNYFLKNKIILNIASAILGKIFLTIANWGNDASVLYNVANKSYILSSNFQKTTDKQSSYNILKSLSDNSIIKVSDGGNVDNTSTAACITTILNNIKAGTKNITLTIFTPHSTFFTMNNEYYCDQYVLLFGGNSSNKQLVKVDPRDDRLDCPGFYEYTPGLSKETGTYLLSPRIFNFDQLENHTVSFPPNDIYTNGPTQIKFLRYENLQLNTDSYVLDYYGLTSKNTQDVNITLNMFAIESGMPSTAPSVTYMDNWSTNANNVSIAFTEFVNKYPDCLKYIV